MYLILFMFLQNNEVCREIIINANEMFTNYWLFKVNNDVIREDNVNHLLHVAHTPSQITLKLERG